MAASKAASGRKVASKKSAAKKTTKPASKKTTAVAKTASKKTATKKTTKPANRKTAAVAKTATKKSATKKVAAKPSARKPTQAVAVPSKKATGSSTVHKTPAQKAAPRQRKPKTITPEQALANTRALLEAKNELAKQPPTYPAGGDPHSHGHAPSTEHAQVVDQGLQRAPGVDPAATEGHPVGRGNQGMRSQS
jgi:hypothetical protein